MLETTKSSSATRELPDPESKHHRCVFELVCLACFESCLKLAFFCFVLIFSCLFESEIVLFFRYLDPVSRDAVSFDHITRKVTGRVDASDHFGGKYEDVRSAAQKECENYVADHYATGTGAVYNATEVSIESSRVTSSSHLCFCFVFVVTGHCDCDFLVQV